MASSNDAEPNCIPATACTWSRPRGKEALCQMWRWRTVAMMSGSATIRWAVWLGFPLDHLQRHAANNRVSRVVDVANVVADSLPHQVGGGGQVIAVVRLQPGQHLGGGVLQRLVERS